jgi:hypothetical protein
MGQAQPARQAVQRPSYQRGGHGLLGSSLVGQCTSLWGRQFSGARAIDLSQI